MGKKHCCTRVDGQKGSCNPCCMPLLMGVRSVALTDIFVSIILIVVVAIVIGITDLKIFLEVRVILFYIFVIVSLLADILVLCLAKTEAWPCLLWAIDNGFRMVVDLVYWVVMAVDFSAQGGQLIHIGFAVPGYAFGIYTAMLFIFFPLYIWFVIVMLCYAEYLHQLNLLKNMASNYQPPTAPSTPRTHSACSSYASPCRSSVTSCTSYMSASPCPPYSCSRSGLRTVPYPCLSNTYNCNARETTTYSSACTSSFYAAPRVRNNNRYLWQAPPSNFNNNRSRYC